MLVNGKKSMTQKPLVGSIFIYRWDINDTKAIRLVLYLKGRGENPRHNLQLRTAKKQQLQTKQCDLRKWEVKMLREDK